MVTSLDVDVPSGRLHVGCWGGEGDPTVVLVHGITASHVSWSGVAEALPGLRLLAPDLRGRGASSAVGGPHGMARHADDVVAVLDAAGVDRAVVVGHSMGGFVSLVLAHRHPERVSRLVLVDGGPPLPRPEGIPPEVVMKAVVGPALDRLTMTFPSRTAYRDFWRAHPAFAHGWSPLIEAYVDYDLVGEPGRWRSRVDPAAVTDDSVDTIVGTDLAEAAAHVEHPTALLLAARGMLDEATPLYPDVLVRPWLDRTPTVTARRIDAVNHYTIVLGPRGIAEVAGEIRAAVAAGGGASA